MLNKFSMTEARASPSLYRIARRTRRHIDR
jgi:hypothetical protein